MTKACNKRLVGKAFKNSNDMHTHNQAPFHKRFDWQSDNQCGHVHGG